MDREQAVKYLQSSGFSEEQIKVIDEAFTCEDAISRKAVIQHICEGKSCYKENCKGVLFNRCMDISWVNDELPPFNPQKPKTDWIVPIILIDEKGEEHDGLMDMRRMLIYLHNIPAETAISLGYTWKSAEGSGE